jgi:hypothetical protein
MRLSLIDNLVGKKQGEMAIDVFNFYDSTTKYNGKLETAEKI